MEPRKIETQTRKVGPPRWVAGIVAALIPSTHRDYLAGDLEERYSSPGPYLRLAAGAIAADLGDRIRESFDWRRFAGSVCLAYIAMAGTPVLGLSIFLLTAMVALLGRDAYIHPARGTAGEAAMDGIVTATVLIASQALLALAAPSLALSGWAMLRGTLIGVAMVAGWRMISRPGPFKDPRREALEDRYDEIWRLNTLWLIGGFALVASNLEAAAQKPCRPTIHSGNVSF